MAVNLFHSAVLQSRTNRPTTIFGELILEDLSDTLLQTSGDNSPKF